MRRPRKILYPYIIAHKYTRRHLTLNTFTLLLLSVFLMQGAALAGQPASYVDTANRADPAYVKDFKLRRDVFEAAEALKAQGLNVLVAWDIDLTLGTPLSPRYRLSLGSDPWWNEQVKALEDAFTARYGPRKAPEGKPSWTPEVQAAYSARFGQLISLNSALHARISLRPVETFVPEAVKKAQAAGVNMMAVTARGPEMEQATMQDLNSDIGVNFSSSAPGGGGFAMDGFRINEKARPSLYRNGVLQTSGQNKGEQLLYVLAAAGYKPDIVFFIDDTEKNARDVFAALQKAGIPARVVRYGHEDGRARAYAAPGSAQPCQAQAELESFREKGYFPADSGVKNARCDAAVSFALIYGSTAPAVVK